MAKYIDAEYIPTDRFFEDMSYKEKAKVIQWLIQAPAADVVEVVHGEWIYHHNGTAPTESTQECSRCHEQEYITLHNENFCPNCGARMSK